MHRRAIEERLEPLTRAQLRRLSTELCAWIGVEAVARLVPDSPFERTPAQRQLALAVVDVGESAVELAHARFMALSLVRASAAVARGLRDASTAVGEPMGSGVVSALEVVAVEAVAAMRFDLLGGLRLVDELIFTMSGVAAAARSFGVANPIASFAPAALFAEVGAHARDTSMSETAFAALSDLAVSASSVGGVDDPCGWIVNVLTSNRTPEARAWLTRRLDRTPRPTGAALMLEALARSADDVQLDGLVAIAELHLDLGESVYAALARSFAGHGRTREAEFWCGEGRARFPDSAVWGEIEDGLG